MSNALGPAGGWADLPLGSTSASAPAIPITHLRVSGSLGLSDVVRLEHEALRPPRMLLSDRPRTAAELGRSTQRHGPSAPPARPTRSWDRAALPLSRPVRVLPQHQQPDDPLSGPSVVELAKPRTESRTAPL